MSKDDDEPKIVRPTPDEIATHGTRIVIASTPLGSSSWFDEQWSTVNRNPESEPTCDVILDGLRAMKPFIAVGDALDRYMARLAAAVQLPAYMLVGERNRIVRRAEYVRDDLLVRAIQRKQWRMRSRMWLAIKGPFRAMQRGAR